MTEEVTLAQLAAEMAQLRQQIEVMNQRLDMIYGAVTRLTDQTPPAQTAPPPTPPAQTPPSGQAMPDPQTSPALSPAAMMSPGSMLDALRRHASQLGMDVSEETIERLKGQSESPTDEDPTAADKEN